MGQGISLIGTWMQRIAMSWLVYRLTDSPLLLGSVDFAGQITAFLTAPLAGVVADHFERRKLILITQALAMAQAGALAYLVLGGHVQVWHLFGLSIFLGMVNGFDMPARQAFIVEILRDRADLPNAIALNSTIFNGARLVGPSLAGTLIAATSEGVCFLFNALSYVAVIGALLAMRVTPRPLPATRPRLFAGLREGFAYAFGSPTMRNVLLLMALVNLAGMPYMALMPVMVRDVLQGGPQTLGFLVSCAGVGAIAGALYLASRKQTAGLLRVTALASFSFAIGIIAFSQSRFLPLSMGLMLLTGFGMMAQMASANTTLQTLVDDERRGRVMSLHMMSFTGTAPFGSLWGGAAATHIGAPATLLIGGLACLLGATAFASQLRRMGDVCALDEAADATP